MRYATKPLKQHLKEVCAWFDRFSWGSLPKSIAGRRRPAGVCLNLVALMHTLLKSKKVAKMLNETLRWRSCKCKRLPAAPKRLLRRTLRLKFVATQRPPAKTGIPSLLQGGEFGQIGHGELLGQGACCVWDKSLVRDGRALGVNG